MATETNTNAAYGDIKTEATILHNFNRDVARLGKQLLMDAGYKEDPYRAPEAEELARSKALFSLSDTDGILLDSLKRIIEGKKLAVEIEYKGIPTGEFVRAQIPLRDMLTEIPDLSPVELDNLRTAAFQVAYDPHYHDQYPGLKPGTELIIRYADEAKKLKQKLENAGKADEVHIPTFIKQKGEASTKQNEFRVHLYEVQKAAGEMAANEKMTEEVRAKLKDKIPQGDVISSDPSAYQHVRRIAGEKIPDPVFYAAREAWAVAGTVINRENLHKAADIGARAATATGNMVSQVTTAIGGAVRDPRRTADRILTPDPLKDVDHETLDMSARGKIHPTFAAHATLKDLGNQAKEALRGVLKLDEQDGASQDGNTPAGARPRGRTR